jgi:predicted DsbA family dithiol-disulfide isomerase
LVYLGARLSVAVRYYTDPACPWSWGMEPTVRRLMVEFGGDLGWTYVMGGLAREVKEYPRLIAGWMDASAESGMPLDPRLWTESPISSTYPACMAVKAAAGHAEDGGYRYLRALREGLMCFRRKLDTTEALVEEARTAALDVPRFRIDLASNATVEAFGYDLDATRAGDGLPRMEFTGEDGVAHVVSGLRPYEEFRAAAEAAGATVAGGEAPGVLEAMRRFGRMATREVEAVTGLPGPRAPAELWRLATEWQVKPVPVLGGQLWELA